MIKGGKLRSSSVLTFAEKCKNILASNWQGNLNTIKVDARDIKEEIYTSKVKYFLKKGKPYIWVPEKDLHNVYTIIDDRVSFSVTSPYPGALAHLLKSIKKLPARLALTGAVVRFDNDEAKILAGSLREILLADEKAVRESSHAVSAILSSSNLGSTPRSAPFNEILENIEDYSAYHLELSSCMYIDGNGGFHEVNLENLEKSKGDGISPFSMSLIAGINQSEMTRRALVLFCITFLKENAKDAFLLSVDRKGFNVLAKVLGPMMDDGSREYQWKELRFRLKQEAGDVGTFCRQLLEMEQKALENIQSFSGV